MNDAANPTVPTNDVALPTERGDTGSELAPNNLDPTKGKVGLWCSFKPTTARDRATLYNAVTGQTRSVESVIGETIMLRDVVFQGIDMVNPVTGEVKAAVRTVLIDTDGKAYACVSDGISKAVRNLIGMCGMPSYPEGIPVMPTKNKAKVGHYYSLEMVAPVEPAKSPEPAKPETKKPAK